MPGCKDVKNPCKICFTPVNLKTGLQCQGACRTWVHFACLNYTPGKIQDIKKGLIQVVCPCPDCKSAAIREYRTDLYTCDNKGCPANKSPTCGNKKCAMYEEGYRIPESCGKKTCKQIIQVPETESKNGSNRNSSDDSSSESEDDNGSQNGGVDPRRRSAGRRNAVSGPCKNRTGDFQADSGAQELPLAAVEQICNTVGQLANQLNELMCKIQDTTGNGNAPGRRQPPNQPPNAISAARNCDKFCKNNK